MDDLGIIHQLIITIGGLKLTVNIEPVIMSWIAFTVLLVFGWLTTRKRGLVPRPLQVLGELLVDQFYQLAEDAMGKQKAQRYGPLVVALFLFLALSNWLGIIPYLEEPTKDLNTPLAMALLGFVIAHYVGITDRGLKDYLAEYFQPFFFMFPLNIIDQLSKIVSISFRLFGNIMGGAIIILVVSHLTYSVLLPPFLNAFFGLFVGTIQAFVFTMLTMVYISIQTK